MNQDQERKLEEAIKSGVIKRSDAEHLTPEERDDIDKAIERLNTPAPETVLSYEEMELMDRRENVRADHSLTPETRQAEEVHIQKELDHIAERRQQLGITPETAAPAMPESDQQQTLAHGNHAMPGEAPDFLDDDKMAEGWKKEAERYGEREREPERDRSR